MIGYQAATEGKDRQRGDRQPAFARTSKRLSLNFGHTCRRLVLLLSVLLVRTRLLSRLLLTIEIGSMVAEVLISIGWLPCRVFIIVVCIRFQYTLLLHGIREILLRQLCLSPFSLRFNDTSQLCERAWR